ncbi:hypothetical protein ACWE42_25265, partial [Sutcliffiella cohnii]
STITQHASAIQSRVTTTTYTTDMNALTSRVSSAESTITQHAEQISLRVEKNGVISSINQSSESIRIQANKIRIDGTTTFASGYDPTSKETPSGAQTKANLAEERASEVARAMSSGRMLYTDPTFRSGQNGVAVYNNSGGTSVTHHRIAKPSDAPTTSTHILEVRVTTGTTSPNHGGFSFQTMSRANAVYIVKFIAKLEVGRQFNWASNAIGNGASTKWLTSSQGTGKYEEYLFKVQCGSSGTFSSTVFFSVSGGTKPFNWQLAYATVFDITDNDLASGWTWGNTTEINGGMIRTNTVDANVLKANSVIANNITFRGTLDGATGTFSGQLSANHVTINGRQLSFSASTDRIGMHSDYTTSTGYYMAFGRYNTNGNWSNLDTLDLMANNVAVGGTITASGYRGTFDVRDISVVGGNNRTILHDHGNSNVSLSATGN